MHWKNLYHATCSGPLITKGVFIKGILGALREDVFGGGNGDAIFNGIYNADSDLRINCSYLRFRRPASNQISGFTTIFSIFTAKF